MPSDPAKLKIVKEHGCKEVLFSVARRPGTKELAVGASDGSVQLIDLAAEKIEPRRWEKHSSYVSGVAWAGETLVSGSWDCSLVWWDREKGEAIRTIENAHAKWIRGVAASPDGKTIATIGDDMVCRLWDAASGEKKHSLRGHETLTPHHYPSMLYAVGFSRDGQFLATGDRVGRVNVWEVASGNRAGTFEAPVMYTWDPNQRRHSIGGLRSLAFSPDGNQIAVGGMGKVGNIDHLEGKARVEVFDWTAGKQTAEFPGDKFSGLVNRLAWAPDGSWLVGAGGAGEGFLCFFDVKAKKTLRQEKVMTHVHDFAISAAADQITCVGHNKIVTYKLG